jgi:hypothetical protein
MTGLKTTGDDAGHNDNSSCATKVYCNNNEVVFFTMGVAGETGKTCSRAASYKDIGNGNGFFSNEARKKRLGKESAAIINGRTLKTTPLIRPMFRVQILKGP